MTWLHVVIDLPASIEPALTAFWEQVLGWPLGEPWGGHPELASFTPPAGDEYVHRQIIDGPPRFHLDLEVADVDAAADRLVALGATRAYRAEDWQSMVSPGGLSFCLCAASPSHSRPEPVRWAEHRSRLVQLSIDLPRDQVHRELAFWRAGLPDGSWHGSDSPEFLGKWRTPGSPVQLLFQRLDEPSGPVRAHLDLGTDDLVAEAARVLGLRATHVRDGGGFVCFRDPAGLDSCVTENAP